MTKIPLVEALSLVRDFGLLVNQAAIYGVTHRVIQQQAVDFFNRMHALAVTHETVEFSIQGDKLAVNGEVEGLDLMSTRNLKERMTLHKLPGIFFNPQLTTDEFSTFISCLARPPVRVLEMGGFEQVLKNANMQGVSLVHFVYERVKTSTPKNDASPPKEEEKKAPVKQQKRASRKTYDLSEEEGQELIAPEELEKQVTLKACRERKKVQTELDFLLKEVFKLVPHENKSDDALMIEQLRSLRDTLRSSTETSKERLRAFLKPTQEIEIISETGKTEIKKAKAHKLTHAEYMQRFAELIQEISQPLTITNSVIEIIGKEQAGPLTEAQRRFLDLALESVDRVNQLVKYAHKLYGEPDSYTPDNRIIQETYQ